MVVVQLWWPTAAAMAVALFLTLAVSQAPVEHSEAVRYYFVVIAGSRELAKRSFWKTISGNGKFSVVCVLFSTFLR